MKPPSPGAAWSKLAIGLLVLLFCTAPTPGDVGGCGQQPQELDPPVFFASKRLADCRRCHDCGIETAACQRACDTTAPVPAEFPPGCLPLVHDGVVCLRALRYAACEDYFRYMSDVSPEVPTECNFCPERR
jgi:hypothetical protein